MSKIVAGELEIPCPYCTDGFATTGDRHARTRQDVCTHCGGTGRAPAGTGKTAATSAPPVAPAVDPVVAAVRADLLSRSQVGIEKYGVTLARDDLSLRDWLQHAYEETLDQANYLKRAIMQLDNDAAKPSTYRYPAVFIEQAGQHKGEYLVRFIDLPEARTFGTTLAQARKRAVDCLATALRGRLQRGEPIPGGGPLGDGEEIVECTL